MVYPYMLPPLGSLYDAYINTLTLFSLELAKSILVYSWSSQMLTLW